MLKRLCSFITASAVALYMMPVYVHSETNKERTGYWVLAEATTGTVLEESGSEQKVPVGVMAKLMTIYIAAEENAAGRFDSSREAVISANANSKQGAQVWLMQGEKITADELMKAVIIGNANDASAAVAEMISGTEDRFVEKMNSAAAELRMNSTVFTNPDGYYEPDKQVSTAEDMVKLVCAMGKHRCYDDYFTCKMDYIRNNETMLVNSNKMVGKYSGLKGYKTGYTEESGYCGAFLAERDGRAYAAVLLGYEDEDRMLAGAKQLLDKGFSSYMLFRPEIPEDIPHNISVRNSGSKKIRIAAEKSEDMIIRYNEADSVTARTALPEFVYAPVKKGEKIGEILFFKENAYVFSVNIVADGAADKSDLQSVIVNLLKNIVEF